MPETAPANIAALEALVDVDDHVAMTGRRVPALPDNWEALHAAELIQMIREERRPLPEGDVDIAALGEADVPEMLALVERMQPGPFRKRTIDLGHYIGIRERGRLVAMAGERTQINAFHEISAVCTSPEAQGRGHARALVGRIVNRMLRRGEIPYLHVEAPKDGPIALYRRLGFVERARFPLLAAKRCR